VYGPCNITDAWNTSDLFVNADDNVFGNGTGGKNSAFWTHFNQSAVSTMKFLNRSVSEVVSYNNASDSRTTVRSSVTIVGYNLTRLSYFLCRSCAVVIRIEKQSA
jgi:ascorbate-specific PTS system EIIC-type component UlaA